MNRVRPNILFILVACLLLQGCQGDVREKLGLKKEAPDEFMVLSQPPLSMPPTFTLEPPGKTSSIIKKTDTVEEAKQTLFKNAKEQPALSSSNGEESLLKNAEVGKADPNIRDILKKDNQQVTGGGKEKKGLFKKMADFVTRKKDPIIDADAERKRLLKNKSEGKNPNEGEVPTIKQENEGILNRVLE